MIVFCIRVECALGNNRMRLLVCVRRSIAQIYESGARNSLLPITPCSISQSSPVLRTLTIGTKPTTAVKLFRWPIFAFCDKIASFK